MSEQVTIYEIIKSHSDCLQDNIYTSLPATVTSYNPSNQSVDVNVDLRRTNPSSGEDFGLISLREVPVMFPSAGGGILSFPITKGDKVLIMFTKFSLDSWLAGVEGLVPDNRQHDINDAIAIIGLFNLKTNLSPNETDVELKFKGSSVTLKATGDLEVTTSGNMIATVEGTLTADVTGDTTITTPTLTLNGNLTVSGTINAGGNIGSSGTITGTTDVVGGGKSLKDHKHTGVTTGGGISGPPQ